MFELMNYWQGKLLCAVITILIFSAIQSYEVNKRVNRINEANSDDYRKPHFPTAPFVSLIIAIIIISVAIIFPLRILEAE